MRTSGKMALSSLRYSVTFILALCEMLFFGGITYGWASLVYVLKSEGYYRNLCQVEVNETVTTFDNDTSKICDGQDANLNLVYTIAAFTSLAFSFIIGLLFDTFGTRFCRIINQFILFSGLLLIIISGPSTPYLLFPGMVCIATGGVGQFITVAQIGNLFGSHRATVVTVLCGAYDASAIVMLFIKLLYEYGISLDTSFSVLTGGSTIFFINTFCLLPTKKIPWPLPSNYGRNIQNDEDKNRSRPSKNAELTSNDVHKRLSKKDNRSNAENCRKKDFPTLRSCVLSPSFTLLVLWFSILQLRIHSFVGTFNPQLVKLTNGNDHLVDHYTKVFSFTQFGGFFASPLSGVVLDRNKGQSNRFPYDDLKDSALGFAITTGLLVTFAVFNIIPILEVQYITFLLQVVSRSFLYGVQATAVSVMFPQHYYGSVLGLCFVLGSTIDLLQYPLLRVTQRFFDNDFLMMNVVLLIACSSTLVLPIYIIYYSRRKNQEVQRDENEAMTISKDVM